MILVDFSQTVIANYMIETKGGKTPASYDLMRHLVINSLRSYSVKFKKNFGEIVLCCDSSNVWRKDFYPQYKAHRQIAKQQSSVNWNELFFILEIIIKEIKEFSPFHVLKVDRCEGDDIIAAMIRQFNAANHIIISNDDDFLQLQSYEPFSPVQWSPIKKTFLKIESENFLMEKVIAGDSGDGVPNILSDNDVFINPEKRQVPLTKKRKEEIISDIQRGNIAKYNPNLDRNLQMIDLRYCPQNLIDNIINTYRSSRPNTMGAFLNYMINNGMKYMIDHITDF